MFQEIRKDNSWKKRKNKTKLLKDQNFKNNCELHYKSINLQSYIKNKL